MGTDLRWITKCTLISGEQWQSFMRRVIMVTLEISSKPSKEDQNMEHEKQKEDETESYP